ncbi:MAG: 23S rRNA (adenine(2503)-C(2))-methyltransferase RlmN [Bacteroides sp.]|nr:23S rRNA (adenine(2503)-C(2))-methyltransferase RlmN [Bacteroides sp.]
MLFYDCTLEMLEDYFSSRGENKAKAKILFKAVYGNGSALDEISGLSDKTKKRIAEDFSFELPSEAVLQDDGETAKALLTLSDGSRVETVLMRHGYNTGVCVSTQVGCSMGCLFCQSGRLKKRRNLTSGEIVSQVVYMSKRFGEIGHISVMGIGEPLDNFENVKAFMETVASPYGFAFGGRHITLSTCGIAPNIKRLEEIKCGFNLAISLHSAENDIRSELMPVNKRWGLEELIGEVRDYSRKNKQRIAFEYILIDGVNDSIEQAEKLAQLIDGIDCFVNLIPYNAVEGSAYRRSENADGFFDRLKKRGINAIFRREFGGTIKAACGQLSAEAASADSLR